MNQNSSRLVQNYPAPNFSGWGGNLVFLTTAPLNTNEHIIQGDCLIHKLSATTLDVACVGSSAANLL